MPESNAGRHAGASLKLKPPWVPYFRFAISVRISCKCYSNRATFPPLKILLISIAYNLRTKSAKSTGSERIGPRRAIFGLFPPWPVNRSGPKTPGILPFRGGIGRGERGVHFETGGQRGIRTLGTPLAPAHPIPTISQGAATDPKGRTLLSGLARLLGPRLLRANRTQKTIFLYCTTDWYPPGHCDRSTIDLLLGASTPNMCTVNGLYFCFFWSFIGILILFLDK
jgi:hypothetical protein